jgi:hypothetical protein
MPTNNNPPPSFRNYCSAELNEDGTITVRCEVKGNCYEHTVDPAPIAQYIAEQFASEQGTDISGLGSYLSKAASAAKKVATSSAVKAVWAKASPAIKAAAASVPGGAATMAVATITYNTVAKARSGDPAAIASIKSAATKALNGNPLASEVMKTAKTFNAMLNVKEGKAPTDLAARLASVERVLNPLLRSPASNYTIGAVRNHRTQQSRFPNSPFSPFSPMARGAQRSATRGGARYQTMAQKAPPPPVRKMSKAMVPLPVPAMPAPQSAQEMEDYAEDEGYEEDYAYQDGTEENVAGYLYNRPYRSVAASMLDGSPGVGVALRSLYANGLDTIANMKR